MNNRVFHDRPVWRISVRLLAEQETDDLEVMGSNPTEGNFLTKFILCCVTLDLSDNLTEMRLTGLSWKTQLDQLL